MIRKIHFITVMQFSRNVSGRNNSLNRMFSTVNAVVAGKSLTNGKTYIFVINVSFINII